MEIRSDFKEAKLLFERLLLYGEQFKRFQDEWVHYKLEEDYKTVYDLAVEKRFILERIYSEGRQFGINMSTWLVSFNDISRFPTLKDFVDFLENNWLQHIGSIEKIISEVEEVSKTLEYTPYAIREMTELHRKQLNLFRKLFIWVEQIKETSLYQAELRASEKSDQKIEQNITTPPPMKNVFLCHASEDKKRFVEPLIDELEKNHITYWYDKAEIKWGDSIVGKINNGLRTSNYAIIFLSKDFISKKWTNRELESVLSIETDTGQTKVLPLMIGDKAEISHIKINYPILSSKKYLEWNDGINKILKELRNRLK